MFKMTTLLTDAEMAEYKSKISKMTDEELVNETGSNVFAAGHYKMHSRYDQKCDALYKEAVSRGKEALYSKGYKMADADARS